METRASVGPTWPEITAYFLDLGFDVRPESVGSMMRKCQPVRDRLSTSRQYIQRRGAPGKTWCAKFESFSGVVTWVGPLFDDPITAYLHAEIENWRRP